MTPADLAAARALCHEREEGLISDREFGLRCRSILPALIAEVARLYPRPKPALPVLNLPVVAGRVWARKLGGTKHHCFLRLGAYHHRSLCGESTMSVRHAVVKSSRPCAECLAILEAPK